MLFLSITFYLTLLLLDGSVYSSEGINVEIILFSVRRKIPNLAKTQVILTEIEVNSELQSQKGWKDVESQHHVWFPVICASLR